MPELEDYAPSLDIIDLEIALQDAARDARRRAFVPSYDLIEGVARGRRTARWAATSVFGVVLGVVIAVALATGAVRLTYPQPAATRPAGPVVMDPALRRYQTTIPVLTWTMAPGHTAGELEHRDDFLSAVFSGLGNGDHDGGYVDDLRTRFPQAPVGGPAMFIDQSVTKAQMERAAANVRKLSGVLATRVVEVTGLWFTVSAKGTPADNPSAVIDLAGIDIGGSAGGDQGVRATFIGPAMDRATFNLLRQRAADAVHIDVSKVVVTAESATPKSATPKSATPKSATPKSASPKD
jgi:hypothetical protein